MDKPLLTGVLVLIVLAGVECKKDEAVSPKADWPFSGKILFTVDVPETPSIYMIDLHASPGTLSVLVSSATEPRVAPDGVTVAYTGLQPGMIDIFKMDLSGGAPVDLTPNPSLTDSWSDWSPDGISILFNRVFYPGFKEGLCIINRYGENLRNLTDTTTIKEAFMGRWSPDGGTIAFLGLPSGGSSPYTLFTISSDGTHLATLERAAPTMPVWSPDGLKIAYQRQLTPDDTTTGLYVFDVLGRQSERVGVSGATVTPSGFSWLSDGRLICVGADLTDTPGEYSIHLVTVSGSPAEQVLADGFTDIPVARPSPDGTWMAIIGTRHGDSGLGLYVTRPGGTGLRKILDTGMTGWITDGSYVQWVR